MITGVGLDSPSSCAAMRCAIDAFGETRFMDRGGEWIIGSAVPLDPPLRGREKIVRMALAAIGECLSGLQDMAPGAVPILLCVAENDRPGRFQGLDQTLLDDVSRQLGVPLHPASAIFSNGRVAGVQAIVRARELIDSGIPCCVLAGVDTFLVAATLADFEAKRRLLTSKNSDGFIPGEAGAAVLLGPGKEQPERQLLCLGVGFAMEKATVDSGEPLRADGLAEAILAAIADSNCGYERLDYRLSDANGEQYRFKEAALARARTIRILKCVHELWHVADCIGEIGAAVVPCAIAVARAAAVKGYAPGKGVLCHFGNDGRERAAMILRYSRHGGG
jgi:3-oxoacyl-[acyl-carrier-protein] synthase-1